MREIWKVVEAGGIGGCGKAVEPQRGATQRGRAALCNDRLELLDDHGGLHPEGEGP